jgi:hypothetical protein
MAYIDVLIPALGGILALTLANALVKPSGNAAKDASHKRLVRWSRRRVTAATMNGRCCGPSRVGLTLSRVVGRPRVPSLSGILHPSFGT